MTFITLLGLSAAVIGVYVTLVWGLSLALKNASIMDIFWGLGFVTLSGVYYGLVDGDPGRKLLITALVGLWGLRLSLHIGLRNWGHPEDFRYANWRKQYAPNYWIVSYFQVFLLQGAILLFVAMPVLVAHSSVTPLGWLDYLGTGIWLIGFLFEAIGDWQLMRFKANPANKGQVLNTGLWAYTRHPNYFGEAVLWWGHWLIALAAGGWWTVLSPVVMTFLLVRVSGVAMLEKTLKETRPGYKEYIERVPAFFPKFSR